MTNADLERLVDTSDEWIRSRTGIERRHVAAEGETTTDLAEHAARRAMAAAGVTAADIDLICVGTTTPDLVFPNVGTLLQERLGHSPRLPGFQPGGRLHGFHVCVERGGQVRAAGRIEVRARGRRGNVDADRRLE